MKNLHRARAVAAILVVGLAGCEGADGLRGPPGEQGPPGTGGGAGEDGSDGPLGKPGDPGRNAYLTGDGLDVTILGAGISATGTATVSVRITDELGMPLDRAGLSTRGSVSMSFILAWLDSAVDGGPGQYTAYTTRTQTSSTAMAMQAAADQNGTFLELRPGEYLYTFGTMVPSADRGRTHTVGLWATRTLEEGSRVADTTYDFVPNGSAVTLTRRVVTNEACNGCHDQLSAHGGARRDVALCILCHSPQSIDPDSGNTVDFKVMIHKIHRGADLPSVVAGHPYRIIGFRQSVNDYSTVEFPQEIRRCQRCHAGANGELYATRPSKAACGACHDDVVFTDPVPMGQRRHQGGTQGDSAPCTVCHPRTGSIAGVTDVHRVPLDALEPLDVQLLGIRNTSPGAAPTVSFKVTLGGRPRDISTSGLTSMRFTIAGPNTDYERYWQTDVQPRPAGSLTPVDAANGTFEYTFPVSAAIPVDATGSYTLGVEAYLQPMSTDPRNAVKGARLAFAVTDAMPSARREIVDSGKCDACHQDLNGHGGSRRGAGNCALCHNPNNVNDERMSRVEGTDVLVRSVNLPYMIHRIHAGEALQNPFVLGGRPTPTPDNPRGTPIDFAKTRYPGRLGNCAACHLDETWNVSTRHDRRGSFDQIRRCIEPIANDADSLCATNSWVVTATIAYGAGATACIGCHDSEAAVAHTELNTTAAGVEACAVCHGPDAAYDVNRMHSIR